MPSQEDYLDSLLKGIVEDENSDANEDFDLSMSDVDELLRSVSEQFFEGEDLLGESGDDIDISDTVDLINGMDSSDEADLNEIQELLAQTGSEEATPEEEEAVSGLEDFLQEESAPVIENNDTFADEEEEDEDLEPALEDDASDLLALLQGGSEDEMDIPSLSDITDIDISDHSADETEQEGLGDMSLEGLLDDSFMGLDAGEDIDETYSDAGSSVEDLMGDMGIGDLFGTLDTEVDAGNFDSGIADLMDLDLGHDDGHTVEKKGGFFSRIWNFLTEEDEEEEEVKDNENIPLSDENKTVIEEVEKEKSKKKKDKKKKKKGQAEEEDVFEDDEEPADDKKKKKKKPKKEKKKEDSVDSLEPPIPEKKLSSKRVAAVVAICATVGLVILICSNILSDALVKNDARKAFYNGDYFTCYQSLYGMDLNESDEVMLRKSECIMRIRLWVKEYETFDAAGSEVEAMDSLIQSVNDYTELHEYAKKWAIEDAVAQEYASLVTILTNKYQLTEEQAREIAAIKDDVQYTKVVTAIAGGETYGEAPKREERLEDLKDVLPEEKELLEKIFGEN